ncbi:MAG: ATP-binding protein [Promethearchaeota archaeon]
MTKINVSNIDIEWEPGKGTCTFEKLPVAMMWVDTTLAGLMSGMQFMVGPKRFNLALQSEGRNSVDADWEVFQDFPNFREGFKAIANIAAVAGWGHWELISIDESSKKCCFQVKDSWEGRYQKALGVCWGSGMVAGKMAGYCSRHFKTNCWAVQTKFIAEGDEFDEFSVEPSNITIEEEIEKLLTTDEATKADMAVALTKLTNEINERKKVEDDLRESEEKFRSIAEFSDVSIAIIQDDLFKFINPKLMEIIGYSRQEVEMWRPKELFERLLFPEDLNLVYGLFKSNQMGGLNGSTRLDIRIIPMNGDVRWLDINSSSIIYQGNSAVLIVGVDITEKKEFDKLIFEENVRLKELDQMRKNLITRISHELKTPLTSIYGVSQMLLEKKDEFVNHSNSDLINILYDGSVRLKNLIEDLLNTSRLDTGKLELIKKKEDLVVIIERSIREMKYLAKSRNLTIKSKLPDNLYFEVDVLRLEQVIINLLSNAIKNTPPAGIITILLSETEKNIDIEVKDTGVGITDDEKEVLFKKFGKIERYGMDLNVDIEGAGLGLFIAKEITNLHNGEIFIESEGRNKGAKFIIRLFKES